MASGILSVATLSTFIGFPISILLGAASFAEGSISGVTTALTKKYQKKLMKSTKLIDIVTPTIAAFEMSVFKALNNGEIDSSRSLRTSVIAVQCASRSHCLNSQPIVFK